MYAHSIGTSRDMQYVQASFWFGQDDIEWIDA